ncbi:MAG: FAD-binding oxidoreductase [Hyphomonadaceae bacterium]
MDRLLDELSTLLGPGGLAPGAEARASANPWAAPGEPLAIARPRSTQEVSAVLKAAHAAGVPVVAWGGHTGLVDGVRADGAIALSFTRMNAIEEVDAQSATMRVQAGCVLQAACEAADAHGLLLPLDLGARGSATIGGVMSTNAGGNRVIRYGMMRDMVLGLEAVLADGTIVSAMNDLIKNNTGYDLKQLFIGSEGTLGVVTRAVLRLRPKALSQNTAFLAVDRFEDLPRLLRRAERDLGGQLSAFEVLWPEFYTMVTSPPARGRPIVAQGHPYYVLIEALGSDQEKDARHFEDVLGACLEDAIAADAVVAKSGEERQRMWALRDDVLQLISDPAMAVFDVSLRIGEMEAYVGEIRANLLAKSAAARVVVFGHMGDGNLHVCASLGDKALKPQIEEIVYAPLKRIGGSVSAEHGIGLQKRAYLAYSRSPAELALMRTLKNALDPKNLLNPGKVLG